MRLAGSTEAGFDETNFYATPFVGNLGSSATLSLPYADTGGLGLVDGTNPPIPASSLTVYTLDAAVTRWVLLPTIVDGINRRVSALTPHFSVFALFGTSGVGSTLAQVRLYPNPWKVGAGGRFDAPALTFDNLPVQGFIRIFNLSGQRLIELPFSAINSGKLVWNGNNAYGRPAASGVYFADVQPDGQGRIVIKFAIER